MSRRLDALRKQEARRLAKLRREAERKLADALSIGGGLSRLRGISDEEWAEAEQEKPVAEKAPREPQDLIDQMSRVQIIVHLAMRWVTDDVERIRSELLRQRRTYYEAELTAQAARAGCLSRRGRLSEGLELTELNEMSQADAASITNTYNYDLARAILDIGAETPTANRWVYANRLQAWETERAAWKQAVIAQYTELTARSKAQSDFYKYNTNLIGVAILEPRVAVCPVCQGWIDRGEVPLEIATANPPPYHVQCVHAFSCDPQRVAKRECLELWMGG